MTEESLKILSVDEICAILIKAIGEYKIMETLKEDKSQLEAKRAEIYVLYKVINDKKTEAALKQ